MEAVPVTTVISCLDVAPRVDALVATMDGMHASGAAHWRFLAIDDGSSDDTFTRLVRAARSRGWLDVMRHREPRGFGVVLRTGLERSDSPVFCTFDAASDCRLEGLTALVDLVERGAEVATGVVPPPQWPAAEDTFGRTRSRQRLSWLYERLAGYDLDTLTSAMRAYRRATLEQLAWRANGPGANAEIMLRALGRGSEIQVLPVPGGLTGKVRWEPSLQVFMTRYLWLAATVSWSARSRRARVTGGSAVSR